MSLYENPFTKRCTCGSADISQVCPVHGPNMWQTFRDRDSPEKRAEKRAENAEKYRSVQIGKVRHR